MAPPLYTPLIACLSARDGDPQNIGQVVGLPATVTGSPRYIHGVQCDGMTYIRRYERPDFFVTMTTNPKWKEIRENLQAGQESHDRPDIIVRVFRQKLKALMSLIQRGGFGKIQAYLYTIDMFI